MTKAITQDWRTLEFFVPIVEQVQEENDFIIKGVAINETTTLNNVKYVSEELQKAAPSFRNVPILLDHRNEVKNIVGRTTENVNYNPINHRIEFEAKIMDKDIREMIKDGRIGSVSIGAKVEDLTEEEDGSKKAIGIRGLEISLVAVPGDTHATLAQAIQKCFHLKEMAANMNEQLNTTEDKMAEEEKKIPESQEAPVVAPVEEPKEEVKEEPVAEEPKVEAPAKVEAEPEAPKEEAAEKTSLELTEMKKQISELKELLMEKKKIKEEVKMEDKTIGEVSEQKESLDKVDANIVEALGKGNFAMYKDYSKESDSKLKRLVR